MQDQHVQLLISLNVYLKTFNNFSLRNMKTTIPYLLVAVVVVLYTAVFMAAGDNMPLSGMEKRVQNPKSYWHWRKMPPPPRGPVVRPPGLPRVPRPPPPPRRTPPPPPRLPPPPRVIRPPGLPRPPRRPHQIMSVVG